ncbi:MAG TPA: hypothetical protein VNC41_03195 [Acidimicrobiia bacterium]|nr:hypothetical protein [Acidimicrobiia bacterium]
MFEVIDHVDPGEALGRARPNQRVGVAQKAKAITAIVGQQWLELGRLNPSPPGTISTEALEAPLEARCADDQSQALIREITEIDCDILQHSEHAGRRRLLQLSHVGPIKAFGIVQEQPSERKPGEREARFGASARDVVDRAEPDEAESGRRQNADTEEHHLRTP